MSDLSWPEAIKAVLADSEEPMHYTDIAERVSEMELRADVGATPANSVNANISISLNRDGENSPFQRVSRGVYSLRTKAENLGATLEEDEQEEKEKAGLINAFGMYWRREFVEWKSTPKILGRQQSGSEVVDFASQSGVYLLHDGKHTVYVGRATERSLAVRLKYHTTDRLNGRWDRFSWFGVFPVTAEGELEEGYAQSFGMLGLVATMEALLIESLEPPQNRKSGYDFRAVEFLQVEDSRIEMHNAFSVIDSLRLRSGISLR